MVDAGPFLEAGSPQPLGANLAPRGVNFAVFSAHARASTCACSTPRAARRRACRCPARTGDIWHGLLPAQFGGAGTLYGYRVHGPYRPARRASLQPGQAAGGPVRHGAGRRSSPGTRRSAARSPATTGCPTQTDSAPYVPRCRVVDPAFDWGGVRAPERALARHDHLRIAREGLHAAPPRRCREHLRGKYLGLAQPAVIDHLRRLGVTTVELMPVQTFVSEEFLVRKGLAQLLGLQPARPGSRRTRATRSTTRSSSSRRWCARCTRPASRWCSTWCSTTPPRATRLGPDAQPARLRQPQRTTGSRTRTAPTTRTSRAAATRSASTTRRCARWCSTACATGPTRCASTASASTSPPSSAATRGGFNHNSPFFAALRSDPVLAYVKLIAEPWDMGPGGYQLGHFPAGWSEWNDRYRDTDARLLARRPRAAGRLRRALRRFERPVPPARRASRPPASTSSPRTTASRCTTWSPTTTGTTRPTSRTASTATRTT